MPSVIQRRSLGGAGGGAVLADIGTSLMVPGVWGLNHNVVPSVSNLTVSANNIIANVLQVPAGTSLSKVGFIVVSCSANATVDVRIETVGADGNPTGTLVSAGANVNHNITTGMVSAWQEVTLGTAAVVTPGQLIAVVISNTVSAGTFVLGQPSNATGQFQFPYCDVFTASWSKTTANPMLSAVMIDGAWARVPSVWPASSLSNVTFGSTSTPDERGNKITLPFKARAVGAWFMNLYTNTSSAFNYKVYDDADTVLVNEAWDGDYRSNLNSTGRTIFYFDSPIELTKDAAYRLTMVPSSTNTVGISRIGVNASAYMSALDLGGSCIETSRTDAGAWTDTGTARLFMGWILDQIGV